MYYTFPDYINEFRCTADSCTDTCCAGWQICVDSNSLKRYRKVRGRYLLKIMRSVDFAGHAFRRTKDGRCAFLRDDGLCDMYMNLGPEALCRTCRNYPKRVEKFGNIRDVTLSMSCPEVARLLMSRTAPVRFVSKEDRVTEDIEDQDPLLYSVIADLREEIISILQNRRSDMETRAGIVFALCNDAQMMISSGDLFRCREMVRKYRKEKAVRHVSEKVRELLRDKEQYYSVMRHAFLNLYRFEPLKENWPNLILRNEMFLYNDGPDGYMELTGSFNEWRAADGMFDIQMEQLLVYYVSAFLCRAALDGDLMSKIHMALIPAAVMHELALSYWQRNNRKLTAEDMACMAYRLSREIENSEENLEMLGECRFIEGKK